MGWFDTVVDVLECYNQPLYAYPDIRDMSDPILYGILADEDPVIHMQRAMFSNLGMGQIRRFNNRIANGDYPYGYADVEVKLSLTVTPALQVILDDVYSEPMTVEYIRVGDLSDFDWITAMLNVSGNHNQADFEVIADISIEPNLIRYDVTGDSYDTEILDAYYEGGVAYVKTKYISGIENPITHEIVFPTNIGPNPGEESWVVGCHGATSWEVWLYYVNSGLYPELDMPDFNFGSDGKSYPECFPAVPVRVKNVNYYDPGSSVDADKVEKQLGIFGVKPELILTETLKNTDLDADAMDNIFIDFGVRIWDESEAGRQYLYTFFHEILYYLDSTNSEDANAECLETMPEGDPEDIEHPENPQPPDLTKPANTCHSISVDTDESNYKLFFSYIENVFYGLSTINADPELRKVYYSNPGSFDNNSLLVKKFHSSSGEFLMLAGYTAMDKEDVEKWIDPILNGTKSHREILEGEDGWNNLKPAVRISNWYGIVYNEGGEVIDVNNELIPERVYEIRDEGDGITQLELPVQEDVRSITYYECTQYGMDAITVYGIGGQVAVEDTDSTAGALVQLRADDTNKLTIPMMFGLLENRMVASGESKDAVDSLIASIHMTIYVADRQVIRTPWWVTVVKVIGFVLVVVSIYGKLIELLALTVMEAIIAATVVAYTLSMIIFPILNEISPWLALAVSAVLIAVGGYNTLVDAGYNLSEVSLLQMLATTGSIVDVVARGITLYQAGENDDEFSLLADQLLETDNESKKIEQSLDGFNGDIIHEALYGENRTIIDPIDPERYFEKMDNFNDIGEDSLDADSFLNVETGLPGTI